MNRQYRAGASLINDTEPRQFRVGGSLAGTRSVAGGFKLIQSAFQGIGTPPNFLSLAFTSPVTAGNLLVACVGTNAGAGTVTVQSVADSLGQGWTLVGFQAATLGHRIWVFYKENTAGGPCTVTTTVTYTSVSPSLTVCLLEYSRAATGSLHSFVTAVGNGLVHSPGPVTVSMDGDLIVTAFCRLSAGTTTVDYPYTLRRAATGGFSMAVADDTDAESSSGPVFHSANAASASWPAIAVTFKKVITGLVQNGYRFRDDDGSETSATWQATQNTPISIEPGSVFRLRTLVDSEEDTPPLGLRLEYRIGGGDWTEVT